MRRLLLISNSTLHGSGYLDHCEAEIREFVGTHVRRVLFVPFALHDRDAYAATVRARFAKMNMAVTSLHEARGAAERIEAIESADALFVGGGNTFRLLDELYRKEVIGPIQNRVAGGMPYIGTSAGSNVACITLKTTNDMPIVEPPAFDALALVPFNINAHYLDPDPDSRHMGETREVRIREFHEMNLPPVVGLREGAMLRIHGDQVELRGTTGARLFRRGKPAEEFTPVCRMDFLLEE